MEIKSLYKNKKHVISFEVFPPKDDPRPQTVYETIDALQDLNPDFISVTYGAGGSTRNKTLEIADMIKNRHFTNALPHLTCVELTEEGLSAFLSDMKARNLDNVLALRGDLPEGSQSPLSPPYRYASDLTAALKSGGVRCIGGACYPEKHFESSSLESDVEALLKKAEAGVDFLITQLFFDNDAFYRFFDLCEKKGLDIPISAGIMPATNAKKMRRMLNLSGASVPKQLGTYLERYSDNPEAMCDAGIAFATSQVCELLAMGIRGIHLYTMNRPDVTRRIIRNIAGLR